MRPRYFDTIVRVSTPEGVILELHTAGPVHRFLAWVVDGLIKGAALVAAAMPLTAMGDIGSGILLILFFLLSWFYPVAFELWGAGATPGKKVFGLRVVRQDGRPVDLPSSLVRNLLRFVDSLPLFNLTGLVSMMLVPGFRRVGDLAAGTLVVRTRRNTLPAAFLHPEGGVPRPVSPSVALTNAEQGALIRFAGRAPLLGEARARELADLVAPLIDHRPVSREEPVESLVGVGAWIAGVDQVESQHPSEDSPSGVTPLHRRDDHRDPPAPDQTVSQGGMDTSVRPPSQGGQDET